MKKTYLLLITLVFILPQLLFSQIKKVESKDILQKNNTTNTKAIGQGFETLKYCSFIAFPQGFSISITNRKSYSTGANSWVIQVSKIKNQIYSKKLNSTVSPPDSDEIYLGNQSPSNGVLNNGTGWARGDGGLPIVGDVYLYKGNEFSRGKAYSKNVMTIKQGVGSLTFDCSPSSFNFYINSTLSGVPIINGASIAFNNTSAPPSSSGSSGSGDWAGDLYDRYYATNGEPGWAFSMVEYEVNLNDNLINYNNGNWFAGNIALNKLNTQEEYNDLWKRIEQLKLDNFATWKESHPFNWQILENPNNSHQLEIMEEEGVQMMLPPGFAKGNYPTPQASGILNNTKKIYPSYLYDEPKTQNWYKGNLVTSNAIGTGNLGTVYKHNPLPSFCNPSNDDYIIAAFLNPLVLEELRQDWSYLTEKNFNELKEKGYDFYDEFLVEYFANCKLEVDKCDAQIMTLNPNKRRKTYKGRTKPISEINNTIITKKSKVKEEAAVSYLEDLIKTEDYYSDLINNKLITINPEWLAIKDAKKCFPKKQAIKNVKKNKN